jgi:hypothetical protein
MFWVQPGGNTHFVTAVYHGLARRVIPGASDGNPAGFFTPAGRG